jgi:hypothetical protein
MRSKRIAEVASGILVFSFIPTQALAHHGWAGQGGEDFTLTGTVTKSVSLAGPHATMQVKDAEGQIWDLTLAPPHRTSPAGLMDDSIPIGAEVTILGKRNMDESKHEVKTERVTYNGRNFDVYPDRL